MRLALGLGLVLSACASPSPRGAARPPARRVHRELLRRVEALEIDLDLLRRQLDDLRDARAVRTAPLSDSSSALRVGAAGFYCMVFVDGSAVGNTPVAHVTVAPGRHRVTCWNADLHFHAQKEVDVAPGLRVAIRFHR